MSHPSSFEQRASAYSLLVLALVAGTAALIYVRPVMVPFILALLAYNLISPIVRLLHRRYRLPRAAAIGATLLGGGLVAFLISLLLIGSVKDFLSGWDAYRTRFLDLAHQTLVWLSSKGLQIDPQTILPQIQEMPVFGVFSRIAAQLTDLIGDLVLVGIFVAFFIIGEDVGHEPRGVYAEIDAKVRQYLVIKTGLSAATGLLVWAVLAVIGVDLALMFGILAFLLNFIPNVGSAIATALPLPVALLQFGFGPQFLLALLLPLAVQFALGNVLEPKLLGDELDLHPVVILLALIFWGLVWGTAGMFLSVPITAVLKIVLSRIERARPLAEALGGRIPGITADFKAGKKASAKAGVKAGVKATLALWAAAGLLAPAALGPGQALAAELVTNQVRMSDAPAWLKERRVEKVTEKVQKTLEWDVRRVTVRWFDDQEDFEKAHRLGPTVRAAADRSGSVIFLGPRVTDVNFDTVFAHELTHVVTFQKYKDAIPKWLEEGLANYVAGRGTVDYKTLTGRTLPPVKSLGHPFKSADPDLLYRISTAAMEMIASRCRLPDLLQLSVGKKLETYLDTFCGIPDLDAELKKWVERKAK